MRRHACAILALTTALAACGPSTADDTPAGGVLRLRDALAARDVDRVWAQLAPETRQVCADALAARLAAMDSSLRALPRAERFSGGSAPAGQVLIDASDNFPTRYALNQLAHETGRPMVHGAAAGWAGQVSVFASGLGGGAPCYRCWVPETPPDAEACDEVGVVGAVTGMTAAAMALEAIKLITGAGKPLVGRVLLLSGLSGEARTVVLRRDPACPVCSKH